MSAHESLYQFLRLWWRDTIWRDWIVFVGGLVIGWWLS